MNINKRRFLINFISADCGLDKIYFTGINASC